MSRRKGELRIVGGAWRSRRIRFPGTANLRPTPDRVRETLFNWLGAWIEGRRVLDLFAGSGALGLEALSRGAGETVFVERSREAAEALEANVALLGTATASVVRDDAQRFLARNDSVYDLVFVDPPYASGLAEPILGLLDDRRLVRPEGYVYVEQSAQGHGAKPALFLPPGFTLHREIRAGAVHARLLRRG